MHKRGRIFDNYSSLLIGSVIGWQVNKPAGKLVCMTLITCPISYKAETLWSILNILYILPVW